MRMDFLRRDAPASNGDLVSVKAGDRARQSPEGLTTPRNNEQPPHADETMRPPPQLLGVANILRSTSQDNSSHPCPQ